MTTLQTQVVQKQDSMQDNVLAMFTADGGGKLTTLPQESLAEKLQIVTLAGQEAKAMKTTAKEVFNVTDFIVTPDIMTDPETGEQKQTLITTLVLEDGSTIATNSMNFAKNFAKNVISVFGTDKTVWGVPHIPILMQSVTATNGDIINPLVSMKDYQKLVKDTAK